MTEWTDENQPDTSWTKSSQQESRYGLRQFQEDFEPETGYAIEGSSTTRRPDAISFDFLTAFTFGPVAFGDTSQGLLARVWRARVIGNEICIARANDQGTGWDDEIQLFTYDNSEASITEIDFAFDQNGMPVVVAERLFGQDQALWIYFFDSSPEVVDWVFQQFGMIGNRTPRVILDDPQDVTNSDVAVFYINDNLGRICFRLQRDRYNIEYQTPVGEFEDTDNLFIEDVARAVEPRIVIIISRHDSDTGTYELRDPQISSLYPIVVDVNSTVRSGRIVEGNIKTLIIDVDAGFDSYTAVAEVRGGLLREPVIEVLTDPDKTLIYGEIVLGTLQSIIIEHLTQPDDRTVNAAVKDGNIAQIVIAVGVDGNLRTDWDGRSVQGEIIHGILDTP